MLNEDERVRLQTIVDGGKDLAKRVEASKAVHDRFLDGLDVQHADHKRRQKEIETADRAGDITTEQYVREIDKLTEEIRRASVEAKTRVRLREKEVERFSQEAKSIKWAMKQLQRGR